MRSLATQTEAELGGPMSVLVRQRRDHVELDQLLRQLELATARKQQDAVMLRINRLVFPHAFAEESVLWPELRRLLPDGEELTLRVEQEHQAVDELVTRLEEDQLEAAERRGVISRLIEVMREDVRDEEDDLLPRLQAATDVRRLRRLGIAWELVRRTSPTRPHPVVSRRPPGKALAALPLTLLDRARDRLDTAAQRWPRVERHVRAASTTAARAAGAVEQLPPLQRGERSSTPRGE